MVMQRSSRLLLPYGSVFSASHLSCAYTTTLPETRHAPVPPHFTLGHAIFIQATIICSLLYVTIENPLGFRSEGLGRILWGRPVKNDFFSQADINIANLGLYGRIQQNFCGGLTA
jgi:hypothetical protein